ncbi:MAG: hypothetical protein NUV50_01870 [Rhodospirillales bacterium]|nr:hypothetical protein [Rhodospirillales bacterium]
MAEKPTLKADAVKAIRGEDNNPTPEERAEFIMQRLEQFIREGRTLSEGMNFKQWQEMAKVEIANAIAESQIDNQDDEVVTKRLLFTFGASFTTIGFWGGLWAYDQAHYVAVAFLCGAAGLVMIGVAMEWRFRKFWKRRQVGQRQKSLRRCQDLTRRIKKMEFELDKEEERLTKEHKKVMKAAPKVTPQATGLATGQAATKLPSPAQDAAAGLLAALGGAKKAG